MLHLTLHQLLSIISKHRVSVLAMLVLEVVSISITTTSIKSAPAPNPTAPPTPCSIPSFGPATAFNVNAAHALAIADFNGDSKLDIVTGHNLTLGGVRLLLGDGNGGFSGNSSFPVGSRIADIAAADFNNDGKVDVIVANGNSSNVGEASLILGNGTGGFGSPINIRWQSPFQATMSQSIAVADFNGDGKMDVAVTNVSLGSFLFTALGDGTGQFTNLQAVVTGGFQSNLIATDLNGDTKIDLAFTNSNSTVSVLIGNGSGQFGPATNFPVGSDPSSLASADFNGDGKMGLATSSFSSNAVSILFNNGSASFGAPVNYSSGGFFPTSVTPGDFNADGQTDLAVVDADARNVLILQNLGGGTFKPIGNFLTAFFDPQFIAAADFNGDERTDLAVAHESSQRVSILINNCQSPIPSTLALASTFFNSSEFLGGGHVTVVRTGSLEGSATIQYASTNGAAVAPDDFTSVSGTLNFAEGEATKRIAITVVQDVIDEGFGETFQFSVSNASGSASLGSPASAQVFIEDDDPITQISISDVFVPEGNTSSTSATFAVSLSAPSGSTVSVNYTTVNSSAVSTTDFVSANGTLTFAPGETSRTINVSVNGDVSAEIDENFFVDLSNPTNASLAVSRGVGTILDDDSGCPSPKFQVTSNLAVNGPGDTVAADLNGDNKKDLLVARGGSNSVVVFLSDGNGGFATPASFSVGSNPQSLKVGDLNGDSKLDAVSLNAGTMSVLLGDGTGGFGAASTTALSNAYSIVLGDVNTDNKLDLVVVGTPPGGNGFVSLSLGDGLGGFGTPTSYATGGVSSLSGTLANLNSDNKLDIVVGNLNTFNVSLLLNNGDGTFGAASHILLGYNVEGVFAGDLNGDNKTDLITEGSQPAGRQSVMLGNGDGTFSSPVTTPLDFRASTGSLADLNNDGQLDLALANRTTSGPGSVVVQFGSGSGAFSSPTHFAMDSPVAIAVADFNGDAKPDMAVPNGSANQVSILLNTCAAAPTTTFQFSSSNYVVNEATNSVNVTVIRNGDASVSASVAYKTTDTDTFTFGCAEVGNNNFGAYGRCDYATSVDTLTFAAGEMSKTLAIPIINDSIAEGTETFNVELSSASGGTLGNPVNTKITINDNDQVNGPNPIFTTPFFVRQHYLDFLSREPEVGEPWSGVLNGCSDVNNNPACDRLTVSGAFFGSPEFQLKGYFVYRFYKLAFNRLPLYTEIVVDMRAVTGATQAEVFQKKATFTNKFVARTEFVNLYNGSSNTTYVNTLMGRYSLTSLTTPDPANPDGTNKVILTTTDLINQLNAATLTRAQVLRAIADSDQVFNVEFNQAFVAMQYYGYLRRTPEPSGFNAWLNYLNANPNDFRTMINGFMNSTEYRLRFGPQ